MRVCFLFLCLISMAACKKTPVASPTSYSFTANAAQYSGNTYTASYVRDSVTGKLTFLSRFYIGAQSDNKYISLTFSGNNYIDTGTYSNLGALMYFNGVYSYNEIIGTYGIMSLDTINHLISGTFQFRGYNSLESMLYYNVSDVIFTNISYKTQ